MNTLSNDYLTHCPMTTHCPIVLKTALNHIMILHDENQAYFVAFSKNKKFDKSAAKTLQYRTKTNSAPLRQACPDGERNPSCFLHFVVCLIIPQSS
jgi:hypothetical protein